MGNALQDKTVVVVGRGSGIARAVTLTARAQGARVIVAGRDKDKLSAAYGEGGVTAETVDITDDTSIATLADRVGPVDHVVSTASARARGKLADLDRKKLQLSFDTKVIGPTMLAKHFAPQINSPGVIDTGAWDSFGEQGKQAYFERVGGTNPARRIGTPEDVAQAVLFAMTNTFLTGVTLKIDGGEPLI